MCPYSQELRAQDFKITDLGLTPPGAMSSQLSGSGECWITSSSPPNLQRRSHPRARHWLRVKLGVRLGVPRASGRSNATEGVAFMEDTALARLPGSTPVYRPLLTRAGLLYHLRRNSLQDWFAVTIANHPPVQGERKHCFVPAHSTAGGGETKGALKNQDLPKKPQVTAKISGVLLNPHSDPPSQMLTKTESLLSLMLM